MKKQGFVYHIGTGLGFYSEFNNMILCMMSCYQMGLNFKLYSKDAFFFDGLGWNKYFKPFCKEVKSPIHHLINRRDSYILHAGFKSWVHDQIFTILSSIYKLTTGNLLTQDLFFSSRTTWFRNSYFDIPELDLKGDLCNTAKTLIDRVYVFNSQYEKRINKAIEELDLPETYIGIHVRGGDKITEKDIYPVSRYMEIAEQRTSCRNAFILTDDYKIIEYLKINYKDWSFYTLTFLDERGYVNDDFKSKSIERREKEMVKVFASVEIIRRSEYFIGTYSSNIGMFLGMVMPHEKIVALDSKEWYIL